MATYYSQYQRRFRPYLTLLFLGICIAVFVYMLLRYQTTTHPVALVDTGAKDNIRIVLFNEWWRLITPAFIHIGFSHILFNGLSIYYIGAEIEYILGHVRFAFIYLVAAFGGNLFSFAFNINVSAGASTAIFGLFACYLVLAYMNPHSEILGRRATSYSILLLINFINGLRSTGIDNWGHFGGVVFGALITIIVANSTRDNINLRVRIGAVVILIILTIGLIYVGRIRTLNLIF